MEITTTTEYSSSSLPSSSSDYFTTMSDYSSSSSEYTSLSPTPPSLASLSSDYQTTSDLYQSTDDTVASTLDTVSVTFSTVSSDILEVSSINLETKQKLSVNDLSTSLQLFGVADYLVFVLMLAICAVIGIYFGFVEKNQNIKKQLAKGKEIEERRGSEALNYLVGGRKMKIFPVSLSLVASFVSGISLLGTSTEIYVYGTQYAFILISIAFSGIISWYIFLPVFCNLQITSTYEYLELRFDNKVRMFGSILFTINMITWLPIVIFVPALAFNQVTGVNIHVVTPIVCIICIFYTCVGGIKAVVWTDVIQSFVMLGSIILVIIKGTSDIGGFSEVFRRNYETNRIVAPELTMDYTVRLSVWSVFIGSSFHWIQSASCNQVMIQRYLSVPDLKSARKTLIIFTIGLVVLLSCVMYNGLLIFARYHKCDPLTTGLAKAKDQLMPLLVMNTLGDYPGMPGLFVAGVFSAALSSLSTGLNSMSAIVLEDFVKPYRTKPLTEKQTSHLVRMVVVVAGVICVALVFVVEKLGMVLQLSATMGAMTSGPLIGVFLMGFLMPWINSKSALSAGILGSCIMAYICGRAQIDIATGVLTFPEKPVTTEGCTYSFPNITRIEPIFNDDNTFKPLHHMSFMFYTAFGVLIALIIGNIVNLFTGRMDYDQINEDCLAPFIRNFQWFKRYHSVQLSDIDENSDNLKKPLKDDCYFEHRFDSSIRLFGSTVFSLATTLWLPIVIYVPALAFNQVTGVNIHIITPVVCLVCIFYTCVGGLKAVIWTDVIQSFIMCGSIITVMIKGTLDVGGISEVIRRNADTGRFEAPEFTWDPTVRLSIWSVLLGGTLYWVQCTCCNQVMMQRFLAVPSLKAARKCLLYFVIGVILIYIFCVYNGLLIFATYHTCDPLSTKLAKAKDQLVPLLVMDILGQYPGMPGMFVAGVFSAALSSLSTGLNSMSAIFLEDFIKPYARRSLTEKETAIIMRTIVVVFGIICVSLVFVVEKLGMVLQLSMTLSSALNGPLFGIFIMGVCCPWINARSALVGGLASSILMIWICIKGQLAIAAGELNYPQKPVTTEGCTYIFANETITDSVSFELIPKQIYHMSFLWYVPFGLIVAVAISHCALIFFGRTDTEKMDETLIAPLFRRFIKRTNYRSVIQLKTEMKIISEDIEKK